MPKLAQPGLRSTRSFFWAVFWMVCQMWSRVGVGPRSVTWVELGRYFLIFVASGPKRMAFLRFVKLESWEKMVKFEPFGEPPASQRMGCSGKLWRAARAVSGVVEKLSLT